MLVSGVVVAVMSDSSNGALPEDQHSQHPLVSTAKLQALNPEQPSNIL